MNTLPDFLQSDVTARNQLCDSISDYRPLLGVWLIKLALALGWYKKHSSRRGWVLEDEEFHAITGIDIEHGLDADRNSILKINDKPTKQTDAAIKAALKHRLTQLSKMPVSDSLNLFKNVAMLGDVIGLNKAERAVVVFTAILELFEDLSNALNNSKVVATLQDIAGIISLFTGHDRFEIFNGLRNDSVLVSTGIIHVTANSSYTSSKLDLLDGLSMLLTQEYQDADTLVSHFMKRASPAQLALGNYPHLGKDADTLLQFLSNVLSIAEPGTNVLLYGAPGTGKTEFIKALSARLEAELYEIAYSDENGDPITGNSRLRAYNLCQRTLACKKNSILMFDEVEDVFPSQGGWRSLFGMDDAPSDRKSSKAWINRTLENNITPAIWITNNANIDAAYLRRFDYSIRFPVPPKTVRMEIARHHLGQFNPPESWLAQIASNDQRTPAQYERAAKLARISSNGDDALARELVEQALDRSSTLLGQKRTPMRNVSHTQYDLRFANTSMPMADIIGGLSKRPRGTFCFYGPAGTGKSELARHIADQIGMPCIVKRASDILSKWVGEAEKNIAVMFAEARQQEAVLVLDEADSFLADRRDAQHSWEVTQVNELLTQMEAFDGIFICTTNLMEKLDQASLRRFAFKVKFDYLSPDQRWEMFANELARLGGDAATVHEWQKPVRGLNKLTPGDFAVAARQFSILGSTVTAPAMYEQLLEECKIKGGAAGSIGFI